MPVPAAVPVARPAVSAVPHPAQSTTAPRLTAPTTHPPETDTDPTSWPPTPALTPPAAPAPTTHRPDHHAEPAPPPAVPTAATGPRTPAAQWPDTNADPAPRPAALTLSPQQTSLTAPEQNPAPERTPDHPPPTRRFLARAALVTASLSVAAALLGLVRDQSLARLFGAGRDTDAFLVAWTVPEFAATLLIEDGLAFALVPAFSRALARRAEGAPGDPVRALVAGTLSRLALAFTAVGGLLGLAAPQFVAALAPGLPDTGLAVDCTRLTATCVLSFGLAGYCSAALRAHRHFLAPAAIYIAYNLGIITAMYTLGGRWGVRAAAFGVAAGGLLMVVVQLPPLMRELRRRRTDGPAPRAVAEAQAMDVPLMATVLLFALCRQSQVLIERFLASGLPAGAISHLNYAQKVAQIPMTLSMMLCTVTFPVVARALAEGDTERARARVERDLAVAAALVLLGAAAVMACAPQLIGLLFQRGAFTAGDTAATAGVMRVYALGLLGQTLTGVLVRSYFSAGRATWYPVGAMAAGIVATSCIGAWAVGTWGVTGIAAGNAAGITVTAVLLLAGMRTRSVPIRTPRVLHELSRPVRAALIATVTGACVARMPATPLAGLLAGGATVTVVFVLLGWVLGAQGCAAVPRSALALTRKLAHVLLR
ncbi:lipid II flippase MurJ [Streptomyces sp. NPDC051917]|uniref:murein biosynthesis integral membrane protein MurJ n=1 Tax=Streptomyces sp. NPDC051917 TaxID=3154754 RepID=UPI00344D32AB